MLLHLQPASPVPIYEQIVRQVIYAVASGGLAPGALIPSMRDLADRLVVHPNTVVRAYQELERLGVLAAIFESPTKAHLKRMFALKRALVHVRRVLSPQRDMVGLLSKRGTPYIRERTALYFRDVYDHLVRLYEQIDAARDLLGNDMDGYLSVQANRTGDVSKQLAIIATIFLPLSFVVGFFGQNFDNFPLLSGWQHNDGLMWVMIVLCVATPSAMLLWFRKKEWL